MLQECVQSILSLALQPEEREILLIDDGSAVPAPDFDGVTVVHQENQGLSAARNKGIELAQGEYIQFVDADDYLLTDAYQHVLDLQSARQPDMLMFRLTHSIPNDNALAGIVHFRSGTEFLRTRNMRASACGYLFRRAILGDLRFYPDILHEDVVFPFTHVVSDNAVLLQQVYHFDSASFGHSKFIHQVFDIDNV